LIKADLHLHTSYSMDCTTSLQQIIDRCRETGINCLAVADHGTIAGALKLQKMAPFQVIVAEEILSTGGEIIGMFLDQEVPDRLSIEETIARIKAQEGLVCIPHPCDRLRSSMFKGRIFEQVMPQIDIIEVFNARSLSPGSSIKARRLAEKYGKLASAGSDAHNSAEIGNAYVEMPEFNNRDEFLLSLAQGKIFGNNSSLITHFSGTWARLKKRLF
jgi:predicted metal-dependent phosphoesterase TrpH